MPTPVEVWLTQKSMAITCMEVREDETTTELDVDRAGPGRRTPGSAQLSSSDDPANLRNQPGKKDQRQQRVGKQSEQQKD